MIKDAIDIISKTVSSGNLSIKECVGRPQVYKTNGGNDLFGYSPDNLSKAALYYYDHCSKFEFDSAESILAQMKVTIAVEELIFMFRKAIFKNVSKIEFLHKKKNIGEVVLELYSRFSGQSAETIKSLLDKGLQIYTDNWSLIVEDEDNVTIDQLVNFYNKIPFPIGCFLGETEDKLSIAYRSLPILLARDNNRKRIFDFGGNSGMLTSAIANSVDVDFCMLIEENNNLLEFAKWRDDLFGIEKVLYVKESIIAESSNEFAGKFDMGICTEVLEHVFDVEETVSQISQLLEKGGLLYQTTSFGMYPEPSHLKKNIKFAGHEDELMAKYGLERVNLQFPIPLLASVKVYIKK